MIEKQESDEGKKEQKRLTAKKGRIKQEKITHNTRKRGGILF